MKRINLHLDPDTDARPIGLVVLDSDIMSPKRAIIQVRIDGVWCEVPIVDSTHV